MNKLKILHLITRLDEGGSAKNTLLTASLLPSPPYHQLIAAGEIKIKSNVKVLKIKNLKREISPLKDLLALIEIYRLIKKEKPKIVHVHTSKAGFLGRIACAFLPVKCVYTPHGHIFYGYFNKFLTKIFILLEKIANYFADRVCALSDGEAEELIKFGTVKKEKVRVIPSGIEENFKEKKNYKIKENPRILSVGRLVEIKGYVYLIKASPFVLRHFPNAKFIICGDGHLRTKLIELAKELGVYKNFEFRGFCRNVSEILYESDIFVMPSLNEGMCRAVAEAMLTGLPVVASKVCGLKSIVKDGETGILFPPKDEKALAEAIIKLLSDEKLREKMGKAGREYAKRYLTVKRMISLTDKLYKELISPSSAVPTFPIKSAHSYR